MVPMKRIMKILLVVMMFLSFFGCRKKEEKRYPERDIDLPGELHSGNDEYLVVHSNRKDAHTQIDCGGYSLYLDTLGLLSELLSSFVPSHYQTVILIRK